MQFNFTCPLETFSIKIAIIGGCEIAKQLTIIAQNLSIETHIITNNKFSPAGQVAHVEHVINLMDTLSLKTTIEDINPTVLIVQNYNFDFDILLELKDRGISIFPNYDSLKFSLNRENISMLFENNPLFNELDHEFIYSLDQLHEAINLVGLPCIIKPLNRRAKFKPIFVDKKMDFKNLIENKYTINNGLLIQKIVDFDMEISLVGVRFKSFTNNLTSEHYECSEIKFSPPISKYIDSNEFICSWQQSCISEVALTRCKKIALQIINYLNSYGIYNFNFFIKDDNVYLNKVNPFIDHTGFLTIHTQNISQFEIFIRTVLELPISKIQLKIGGVARPILSDSHGIITVPKKNFMVDNTFFYIFGKRYDDDDMKGMIIHTELDIVDKF